MSRSNKRLYDNTRLSDYRRCPRYYYFRHVRDWALDGGRAAALAFGGSWHAAMDVVWDIGPAAKPKDRRQVINAAYKMFVQEWVGYGMPHPDEIDLAVADELGPRTPARGLEMLEAYYTKRQPDIRTFQVLEIERPFAVPLSPDDPTLFYVGRIDKIVAPRAGRVRGLEHKTTTLMRMRGSEHRIGPSFGDSFSPNSQVDGYLYALHLLFPELRADVWVDAALVHKKGEDFLWIPVERQMQALDLWLWETHQWINEIEHQTARLHDCKAGDRYLAAFPKNTGSCFNFNTSCSFLDLCKARPNPLQWTEPPSGYKIDRWDPLDHIGHIPELA